MADAADLKALRDERAAIASQAENLQAHLKVLKDRLKAIDAVLNNTQRLEHVYRARWGSAAYRRKQIL